MNDTYLTEKSIEIFNPTTNKVEYYIAKTDGIKDCKINNELNGESSIEFSYSKANNNSLRKWAAANDINNVIRADGKEYTTIKPDATSQKRQQSKALLNAITAVETYYLLDKQFCNISNDTSVPNPNGNSVIILSGGTNLSNGLYRTGSAGHALYALLQGSGWTLQMCDVDSCTYDLETSNKSRLANIKEVVKLWGGILVWDSINKTVSLRDESKYQVFNGFQIKYGKNLKSLEKTESKDIITRLYPYGENQLSIASINGGKEYIDNFSYTDKVLEGTIENADIYDQQTLLQWGQQQSNKLCKPQTKYSAQAIDLSELSNYRDTKPVLGYMADVIDEDIIGSTTPERKRIIKYSYDYFRPWNCDIDLGDRTGTFVEQFVDLIYISKKADSTINNNHSINGGTIKPYSIPEVNNLRTFSENMYSRVEDAEGNISLLTQTASSLQSQITDAKGNISTLSQYANSIDMRVENQSGDIAGLRLSVSDLYSQIDLKADKITLEGYVTISALGQEGATTINGANITTGTISADRIQSGAFVSKYGEFSGSCVWNNNGKTGGIKMGSEALSFSTGSGADIQITSARMLDLYAYGGYIRAYSDLMMYGGSSITVGDGGTRTVIGAGSVYTNRIYMDDHLIWLGTIEINGSTENVVFWDN